MPELKTASVNCEACGNGFLAPPSKVRKGLVRFCSRVCRDTGRAGTLEERFWRKVQKADGCWLWTGALFTAGYGKFTVKHQELEGAHRMAWLLTFGAIPDGLQVCHACDNPPCCNPKHLMLGTTAANHIDARLKGRSRLKVGNSPPA